ncbi:hypothetical protein [Lysinibacillus sp. Ag94]|uniref:hypothetical protein n=1 Tax=Lysinibacillus sp. Ag94 TaxID=2936682 RepID=UPI00200DABE9|nr:hypothetical protein [Lysinibacillus sp. Ag94]UPW82369.1 hypothetical protein MY533_16680 [Lysinibacillus sp. Ag94]
MTVVEIVIEHLKEEDYAKYLEVLEEYENPEDWASYLSYIRHLSVTLMQRQF